MKKLILLFLFIPLGLFSQYFATVPDRDRLQIRDLDSGFNYSEILLESYYYDESRKNFRHTREWLNGSFSDIMQKSFDLNGTLREELLSGKQNYLRLFNQWGKLKVEILLNEDGFKDGIETFWHDEYNDYKPDPPLWKRTEITYSNGNFVSSKTFAYKSDAVDNEVILLNEHTESIFVQWLESEWCYYHGGRHIEIKKDKNDPEYIPFGKTLWHNFKILEKKFVGGPGIKYGDFPEQFLSEKYKKGDKFDFNNPENNNFPDDGIIEYTEPNNTFYRVKLLDSTYINSPYSKEKIINSKYFEKTVDLRFYLSKNYSNGTRTEFTSSRIYENGGYSGLYGTGGKAGKDRYWWPNGNLQKEVNYQTIEKTKTSFKEGFKNNPEFYLNSHTNGFTREWYEGGELLSETYFEDNSFKSSKSFYASGNLKEEKNDFNSDDGKNENIVEKKYFANGNLKYSYSFLKIFDSAFIPYSRKSRVQLGSSKETHEYNEDGVLIFLETYKDNQLIARSKFDSIGTPIFKIENGITYYLGNKVFDRNNNVTKSYFKNGQLASLIERNDTFYKESRWLISGEKEYEKVSNRINNTGNIKMWQNTKLVYDINLSNGSVIVNEKNKIETNNFLNYSRESSGVIHSMETVSYNEDGKEIEIFNSPYGEKIGEYNDYLNYFSSFQYGYEEYGIEYSDHINGRLKIGPSLWINDDVSFSSWLESTSYGNAWSPGLVLRSKPDKDSEKIIAFQGESFSVIVLGEFINGYSKVRVDYEEGGACEGDGVTKSWEGWAKVIDDFGNPNIDYPARGC